MEEILDRRIGLNELYALAAARAYVDAQAGIRRGRRQRGRSRGLCTYLLSSEGQRDGLYWPTAEGEPESPLGPLVADAVDEGYLTTAEDATEDRAHVPFHGYFFKILTGQGARAPGGARSYVRDGNLVDGFGLVAWPATYGNSGIMTFQVNQRGMVYEADLGEDTATIASAMTEYDPGEGWDDRRRRLRGRDSRRDPGRGWLGSRSSAPAAWIGDAALGAGSGDLGLQTPRSPWLSSQLTTMHVAHLARRRCRRTGRDRPPHPSPIPGSGPGLPLRSHTTSRMKCRGSSAPVAGCLRAPVSIG